MIGRLFAALTLVGTLAGCDDNTVSSTERRTYLKAAGLIALQDTSGLLVEIHGVPWTGATPEQIASTLRMPQGVAREVRFRDTAPGAWIIGEGARLVLHFNPIGDPDSNADCRATEPFKTAPPQKTGFTVNSTLCKGDQWLVHGFLKARAVEPGDWFEYTFAMQKMLVTLFPED